jgi:hypothetical protein
LAVIRKHLTPSTFEFYYMWATADASGITHIQGLGV